MTFLPVAGKFSFSTTASKPALGPTQSPTQWLRWTLTPGVKWPGCEADHAHPSGAGVKNAWSYTSTPLYVFMAWYLVKYWDSFTFTFSEVAQLRTFQ